MTEQTLPKHSVEHAAVQMSETDGYLAALLLRPFLAARTGTVLRDPVAPGATQRANDAVLPETPAPKAAVDADTLKSAGMIDWAINRGRLSEEFRIVQGQLLQTIAATSVKAPALANIVMMTSCKPGEGKTFSSINLAGSLASCNQRRVILVDCDVKGSALTNRLGLTGKPGLLNLLFEAERSFADLLADTDLPMMRVMPVGQGAISGGKPAADVIRALAEQYPECLILLDTPACLSSSDPSRFAAVAGFIVMVVQAQQTQAMELEAALDLVDACPSITLMLNKLQLTGSDTFGAYAR